MHRQTDAPGMRTSRPDAEAQPGSLPGLALAAAVGLLAALLTFPADFVFPRPGEAWAPIGDTAQHVIVQRYFIGEPWGWPPLVARGLNIPEGTHIAMADGIPLLALLLKALAPVLPEGFHGVGLFYALATVLQPVAAVWALQGAGERRLLPALAVAAASLAIPAWLARIGHAALTGHFLLLMGLGFYLRLVRAPRTGLWAWACLTAAAALLIHPYLAAMVLALLGAVPATLLWRGDRRWRGAAVGAVAAATLLVGLLAGLGYLGAAGLPGYGYYGLNLLSPVWPYRSGLLPGLVDREIAAHRHDGWEGYNWLGVGLLAALAAVLILHRREAIAALRAHAGLVVVLLGLTLLAVTHRVGLGTIVLNERGVPPAFIEQFRGSARFFWPVTYALLLGAFALLLRQGRRGVAVVLACAALQLADSVPLRRDLAAWAATRPPWLLEAEPLREAITDASRVTLLPSWRCIPPWDERTRIEVHQALLLASERGVPVTTMHLARWRGPIVCRDDALAAAPFVPGEVRLVLAQAQAGAMPRIPEAGSRCRAVGTAQVCLAHP